MDQIGRISNRTCRFFLGIKGLWEIVCGDEDLPEAKAAQAAWLR
jgi:hypothetical protein